jgi:protoporphyrinogen IX oxidase
MSAGFLGEAYAWIKALHVIFVIFWMAGMFMLPRFFAYHVEDMATYPEMDVRWQQREARLMHIIINPAMMIAWICGLALAFHGNYWQSPWFLGKFLLVLVLSGVHGFLSASRKAFVRGHNRHSSKFFRALNEIPTLATIPVVILVIVQPWG